MQVIIPLAGKGTRLRPHTHLVPKPLLKVAGRPVMDWVMDRLSGLAVEELIFITGHLKDQVEAYARARYKYPSRFIEQKVMRVLAAVQLGSAAPVAFELVEIGQDVVPAPADKALIAPTVVIAGMPADRHHPVERRGAAEHSASGHRQAASVELGFGFGDEPPGQRGIGPEL